MSKMVGEFRSLAASLLAGWSAVAGLLAVMLALPEASPGAGWPQLAVVLLILYPAVAGAGAVLMWRRHIRAASAGSQTSPLGRHQDEPYLHRDQRRCQHA